MLIRNFILCYCFYKSMYSNAFNISMPITLSDTNGNNFEVNLAIDVFDQIPRDIQLEKFCRTYNIFNVYCNQIKAQATRYIESIITQNIIISVPIKYVDVNTGNLKEIVYEIHKEDQSKDITKSFCMNNNIDDDLCNNIMNNVDKQIGEFQNLDTKLRKANMISHFMHEKLASLHDEVIMYYVGICGKKNNFQYNGEIVRYSNNEEAGIGGTESAAIITMETIATMSYFSEKSKFYVQGSNTIHNSTFQGVTFLNEISSDVAATVTILILPSFLRNVDENFFEYFTNLKGLIIVGHCYKLELPYEVLYPIKTQKQLLVQYIHLNGWSKNYFLANNAWNLVDLIDYHQSDLPNPIFWDIIDNSLIYDINHDRKDWIYSAAFERCGELSMRVFCNSQSFIQPNSSFYILDYYQDKEIFLSNSCDGVQILGSMSKSNLYKTLSKTKYFVYLLVLPPNNPSVHKDMFPTCIVEAIMLGVRVIMLPVAGLPLIFSSIADFIPVHDLALAQRLLDYNYFTIEPSLHDSSFVDHIVSFIHELDQQDFTFERIRRMSIIRKLFNEDQFKNGWSEVIQKHLIYS